MPELESNATFTTTFKAGKGFEAPWIVLRADTESDLNDVLAGLNESGSDTIAAVVAVANAFAQLYIDAQPTPEPAPAAPERNNAPPVYGVGPNTGAPQAPQGGLIPNITTHPYKACKCGEPLIYKKDIPSKFGGGPAHVFECPMRDWQDDESKKSHDSVFVNS